MVLLVNNRTTHALLCRQRVGGTGFFSNLWGRIKGVFSKPSVKKMVHSGLDSLVKLGSQQLEKHLPTLAHKTHEAVQQKILGKKEVGPMSDRLQGVVKSLTKHAQKGMEAAKDMAKKKFDEVSTDREEKVEGGRLRSKGLINSENLRLMDLLLKAKDPGPKKTRGKVVALAVRKR